MILRQVKKTRIANEPGKKGTPNLLYKRKRDWDSIEKGREEGENAVGERSRKQRVDVQQSPLELVGGLYTSPRAKAPLRRGKESTGPDWRETNREDGFERSTPQVAMERISLQM